MECDRLKRLIKNWYAQVQDETMAPARMISFMRQHVADCATCLGDPFVRPEIDKITNIILPPEKLKNSVDEESVSGTAPKKVAVEDAEEEDTGQDNDDDDDNDNDDDIKEDDDEEPDED